MSAAIRVCWWCFTVSFAAFARSLAEQLPVVAIDELVVLKTAAMPAVLLEAGVIVNREEERAVQQPEMRRAISTAVERGLMACGAIN